MHLGRLVVKARMTDPNLEGLDFVRTHKAIADYYRECAAGPEVHPGWLACKQWRHTCDGLASSVREAFFEEASGAYSRDECLAMSVARVQCMLPRRNLRPL
jgi:hypothetical protein